MKQVKNIVIIGGGTSGWTTALNFLNRTDNVNITVVATPEKPIIGVGESTTGLTNSLINFNRNINIDEKEFLQKTNSTFKIGIHHKDWHTVGESFYSPLGDEFENSTYHPSIDYDYYRIYHIAKGNKPYTQIQGSFMKERKTQFLWVPENDPYKEAYGGAHGKVDLKFTHVAYHLDAVQTGVYLKDKILKDRPDRVSYIENLVTDVNRDDKGFVTSLKTKEGNLIKGDLFVDCSGFFRLLINDDNDFISWENNLTTNRAIIFPKEYDDYSDMNPYTTAQARKNGWEFNIPLQHRVGRGYIFNDRLISVDQAKEEIDQIYGHDVEIKKDIKFTPGRMKKAWNKNVLSVGLSTGFVEPLEATAIHMSILQVNIFCRQFFTEFMSFDEEYQQDTYNRIIGDTWDDIRDFIVAHYFNTRKDTDFWIEASSDDRMSPRLKGLKETWKTRMPRFSDYSSSNFFNFYNLGNTLWYQVLIGMKVLNPEVAERELKSFGLWDIAEEHYKIRNDFIKHVTKLGLTPKEFYENELQYLHEYYKVPMKYVDERKQI